MDPRWSQQPPPWQAPYQAGPDPNRPSGLLKASGILMLISAILSAVGALFIVGMGLFFTSLFSALESQAAGFDGTPFSTILGGFYVVYGVITAAGAVCQFVSWGKLSRLDLQSGFVWGLVGSLLPPLGILALLGAIFAKTCPEAEAAAARQRQAWSPPQAR